MNDNTASNPRRGTQLGLTLVEVLVAIALLAVLLVPAIQALQTGFLGAEVHSELSDNHYSLVARLEAVLAEPFDNLVAAAADSTTPNTYSDTAGEAPRILVYISFYDADNVDADNDVFTDVEPDVLWVKVVIDGSAQQLSTLVTRQ